MNGLEKPGLVCPGNSGSPAEVTRALQLTFCHLPVGMPLLLCNYILSCPGNLHITCASLPLGDLDLADFNLALGLDITQSPPWLPHPLALNCPLPPLGPLKAFQVLPQSSAPGHVWTPCCSVVLLSAESYDGRQTLQSPPFHSPLSSPALCTPALPTPPHTSDREQPTHP